MTTPEEDAGEREFTQADEEMPGEDWSAVAERLGITEEMLDNDM